MDDKEYYSVEEIANILGVKISTVYNWSHIGYIPTIKVGRLIRFKKDSIIEWLGKQERKGRTKIKMTFFKNST